MSTRKTLPVLQCNPIEVVERAKKDSPETYKQLADEYYKTGIGGQEFLDKHNFSLLAWAIVQLR